MGHGMLETLSMETMWKIDHFSARSLASMACSLAKLGFWRQPTLKWMTAHMVCRQADYAPEDIAHVLSLLAMAGTRNLVLINSAASEVARKGESLCDESSDRCVQAFTQLGEAPRGIFQPMYHSYLVT